jgi:Ca-activated chloride channel family protein
MEQVADNGNGSYAYVDDLDEAQKLFVEDLPSTLQVIALNAKTQVDFNPDEVAYYVPAAGQA